MISDQTHNTTTTNVGKDTEQQQHPFWWEGDTLGDNWAASFL